MKRPALTKTISIDDFAAHYWLKSELVAFCCTYGISASGGKLDIARRIRKFLSTGRKTNRATPNAVTVAVIHARLTRDTVIGAGWRCSESVRAFFQGEVGRSFRFNAAMRDFIHRGVGRTLGEGIAVWDASHG